MSTISFEVFDPVEGDLLTTYVDPIDLNGLPVTGATPDVTVKVPDGNVVILTPAENPVGHYTSSVDTTTYGGGNYIFRWKFSGGYVGAIEYKTKVKHSKVLP